MSDPAITGEEFLEKFQSLPPEKKLSIVVDALNESERQKQVAVVKAETNQEKAKTLDRLIGMEKWWSMQQAAGLLGYRSVGQNNLIAFLRSEGVLMNTAARWNQPYREYIERGYFKIVEQEFDLPDGTTKPNWKTVVSQKGLDFIRRKLSESNNDQPVEE
jgi:phage antirepressor YoqD-like protein